MVNKTNLQSQGYALTNVWGGPLKKIYYAPDGRMKETIPELIQYRGGIIQDALLTKGYTLTPPENPKPHCNGCGNWHDTEGEVGQCIKKKKVYDKKWERFADKKLKQVDTSELEDKINRLEAQIGEILQRTTNETELSEAKTKHKG